MTVKKTASLDPEKWVKMIALVLLVAAGVFVYIIDPAFYPKVWHLITSGNLNEMVEFIGSYGIWAMVISILIDILINALGFLPSIFISTANGVLFGIIPGIIISWFAECIGVIISFVLMRSFLRNSAESLIKKSNYLQKVDEFSGKNGFKMMLFARTLPYFPSGIITALGAVSSISLRDYVVANFIGKLPSTAIEVVIGHDVVNYEKNMTRLAIVVVALTFAYGAIWWFQKKKQPEKEKGQ